MIDDDTAMRSFLVMLAVFAVLVFCDKMDKDAAKRQAAMKVATVQCDTLRVVNPHMDQFCE